mmetsp:Transcript_39710/g.46416  ORF Transcript_39710/g.46416 Transcript_39710/m.46416 type:complete len:206 (+) Transcript_39710:253-870(+)
MPKEPSPNSSNARSPPSHCTTPTSPKPSSNWRVGTSWPPIERSWTRKVRSSHSRRLPVCHPHVPDRIPNRHQTANPKKLPMSDFTTRTTATETATAAGDVEKMNRETSREDTIELTAKKRIETSRFSVTANPGFIRRSERRDRISRSERFDIRGRHPFSLHTPVKQPQPDQLTAHATWSSSGVESRRSRSMRRTCSSSRSRPKSK